jgi:hypothetical protein
MCAEVGAFSEAANYKALAQSYHTICITDEVVGSMSVATAQLRFIVVVLGASRPGTAYLTVLCTKFAP